MNPEDYVKPLIRLMQSRANGDQSEAMAAYMRDQFPFLGIKSPERRALLKQFFAERGLPPVEAVEDITWQLWQRPEREHQYVAIGILEKLRRKLAPESVELFERLVVTKSWWDTVDGLASNIVGFHFQRFPELQEPWIDRWRAAENFWLRRITLLFQLKYKSNTDVPLLFALIEENRNSDEFFIQKAIGWALREYSKTDAAAVKQFIAQTDLAPLSVREGLKWLARG